MMLKKVTLFLLAALLFMPVAFADAPVVAAVPSDDQSVQTPAGDDTSPPAASTANTPDTSSMSIEQRVAILERQVAAANQINTMNQVNDMQQQLQELQGQLEELSHVVQTLQSQSTSQYADVDQRLRKLEGGGQASPTAADPAATSASAQPAAASANPQSSSNAEQVYQAAYDKVKSGNYGEGIAGMQQFLTQFPTNTYVPNAHYWLGQMYLMKGDGKNAAKEFDTLINQYPQNPKVKDASLKLGFAYLLENKTAEARAQFKKVMRLYPGTSTAQLAEARLAQMP